MSPGVVTVCVPVWNCAPYIRQCVESVLAQEYPHWILAIADNASTDGTWEILNTFRHPRLQLYRHPSNLGPVANWNFLLDRAETEFVSILGGDDFFYPNHLRRKVILLQQHPEAPLAHGGADFVNAAGDLLQPAERLPSGSRIEPAREMLQRLLRSNYVNTTSILFRRQALRAHNLRFDPRLLRFIDWHLVVELMLHFPYAVCDSEPTLAYRVHAGSGAQQNRRSARWALESREFLLLSFDAHPEAWAQLGFDVLAESRRRTADLWRLAFRQWRHRQPEEARQAWRFFRQFHSPAAIIRGLGPWLVDGITRRRQRDETA